MTDQLPSEEKLLQLLIASAYANYCSSLIGGPQVTHERFKFFKDFKPGDLVMEVSSLHSRGDYDRYRIGYLVSNALEPFGTEEWWEEVKDQYDERPKERVFTIDRLDGGGTFRWTNAMMIRVVTKITGEFP